MNTGGNLPVSETAARRVSARKTKVRKGKGGRTAKVTKTKQREPAAVGTLTRTKSLLLAALRVWELKHRIGE